MRISKKQWQSFGGEQNRTEKVSTGQYEKISHSKAIGEMGFRDLSSFNQALVANQGWRIMQFPSSLVARVLKARYFKHTGFMNAGLGSKLSFVWRSIVWGRQVVHKGARWRIGNGQNVLVYENNWIPKPTTFKPISALSMGADTTIAE